MSQAEASATALSSGITTETESADQTTFQWVHEKTIFTGDSPRVKYRCEKEGCPAKKLIVMTKTRPDGGNFEVKYSGQHQHS